MAEELKLSENGSAMQEERSPDLFIEDAERSLAEHPMVRRDSKVVSTSSPQFN